MNTLHLAKTPNIGETPLISSLNESLVNEYLSWKQSYTSAAPSRYKIWVTRFQDFVSKQPEHIGYADYAAFGNSLRGRHAPCGVQYAMNVVHNYLRFFAEQGRLRFPLYLARVPRACANSYQAITEEEYRKIIAHLSNARKVDYRNLAIIMLLHDTGLRIGELLSLDIEDVEEDCSAVVRTEKTTYRRRIYWNADTDEVLQQYLVQRVNGRYSETDALFVASTKRAADRLNARTVQQKMKGLLRACEIKRKLSPHSFRHAFVHRLAKLGVPDAIIAQLVGHRTPTTIAHYTRLSRPELKEFASRQLMASAQHPLSQTS